MKKSHIRWLVYLTSYLINWATTIKTKQNAVIYLTWKTYNYLLYHISKVWSKYYTYNEHIFFHHLFKPVTQLYMQCFKPTQPQSLRVGIEIYILNSLLGDSATYLSLRTVWAQGRDRCSELPHYYSLGEFALQPHTMLSA